MAPPKADFRSLIVRGKGKENLTKEEIESVGGFKYADIEEVTENMSIKMKEGFNQMDDGEIFYVSNPALGLWAFRDRFRY